MVRWNKRAERAPATFSQPRPPIDWAQTPAIAAAPMTVASSRRLSPSEFLQQRINYERTTNVPYSAAAEFKLDRMGRLMLLLGDPHLGLKAIHIAGTKGKGSTAAMIAAILQAAGYRTGLYTSPHLKCVEERVVIDGQPCPSADFLALAEQVEPAVDQLDREAEA